MKTRIKYDFTGPIGVSKQVYRVNGQDITIVINKEEFKFEFVNLKGDVVLKGGKTKNYAVLLRQAKRELVKMGYKFGKEKRDRDYGLVKPKTPSNKGESSKEVQGTSEA